MLNKQIKTITKGLTGLFIFLFAASIFTPVKGHCKKASPHNVSKQQTIICETYPVRPMPPMYYGRLLLDRMEYIFSGKEKRFLSFETTGWYGGDYQRIWLEAEGDHDSGSSRGGEFEKLDLLYGRLISAFWNLRTGIGYKGTYGANSDERFFWVLGIKGLAPFVFEVDSNFRVSNRGEVLMDLEAEYDIWITQRLAIQPRFDASFSFNRIKSMGIGPGFDNLSFSARLRYEITRQFAPYLGISWQTMTGSARDIARHEGEPRDVTRFFAGIRLWF